METENLLGGTLSKKKRKELYELLTIDGESDVLIKVKELGSTIVLNKEGNFGHVEDISSEDTNLHALIDSALIRHAQQQGRKLTYWGDNALM